MSAEEEGADRAAVYDDVLTEVSGLFAQIDEGAAKLAEVTNRVTELTDSNLKLLDKIRYIEPEQEAEADPEPAEPEITLENLFEEV